MNSEQEYQEITMDNLIETLEYNGFVSDGINDYREFNYHNKVIKISWDDRFFKMTICSTEPYSYNYNRTFCELYFDKWDIIVKVLTLIYNIKPLPKELLSKEFDYSDWLQEKIKNYQDLHLNVKLYLNAVCDEPPVKIVVEDLVELNLLFIPSNKQEAESKIGKILHLLYLIERTKGINQGVNRND